MLASDISLNHSKLVIPSLLIYYSEYIYTTTNFSYNFSIFPTTQHYIHVKLVNAHTYHSHPHPRLVSPQKSTPSVTILSSQLPYEFQLPRHDRSTAAARHSKPNTLASMCRGCNAANTGRTRASRESNYTKREREQFQKSARTSLRQRPEAH